MKICLVCSHGGHLTETLQLLEAFEGHEIFFVTYHSLRNEDLMKIGRVYSIQNIGSNIWRMLKAIPWALSILLKEKPNVIFSLGAEVAIPFFYLGKLLRTRTIFIESWSRLSSLSGTGRIVYPVSDVFLVQWEQMLKQCGKKARYEGAIF